MNKKQYNNVINHTLKHEKEAQTQDSLAKARAIFNNMGVALPSGNMKEVCETIKTDSYMGWKSCTMQEAKELADQGIATIGISENRIVVFAAADEEEPAAETAGVMTLSENTSAYAVSDLAYYAYTNTTTNVGNYGCGGKYRQIDDSEVNCFEYAMLYDTDVDLHLTIWFWAPELNSSYFIKDIIATIELNCGCSCRSIDAYNSVINANEYRIAARVPNKNGYYYHFIYQLSDGTWAGKDATSSSQHFGKGNPSVSPEMWSNDRYSPDAGTIYFAVTKN